MIDHYYQVLETDHFIIYEVDSFYRFQNFVNSFSSIKFLNSRFYCSLNLDFYVKSCHWLKFKGLISIYDMTPDFINKMKGK